jgi:hypothetical protein
MKADAIRILYSTYENNPAVEFTVGKDAPLSRRKKLASWVVSYAMRRQGLWISKNGHGAMVLYPFLNQVPFWTKLLEKCWVFFHVIPFAQLPMVLRRSNQIAFYHKQQVPFLHCWYIGVEEGYKDGLAARELFSALREEAKRHKLPVLAETTIEKNKRVYERIGFKLYATIETSGMKTYLLRFEAL